MRDSHKDLRVIRTRESIREALVELINEKGFEAINVKDITSKANINRSTFYAHYLDKYDLMTKCEEAIMNELSNIARHNFPKVKSVLEQNPLTVPYQYTIPVFELLYKHKEFMKAVLSAKGDLSFQIKLKELMWDTLLEHSKHSLIDVKNMLVPNQYLSAYMSSAMIGVIQQWLITDCQESPQEMANSIAIININGPYFAAGLKK